MRQSSSYDEDDMINYTLSNWDILGTSNVSHSETIQEMTLVSESGLSPVTERIPVTIISLAGQTIP